MGNQTLHHLNPCSENITIQPKLTPKVLKSKIPSVSKLQRIKSEIQKTSALKPPNLQETQIFCQQLLESFSTDQSELKNFQMKNFLNPSNFAIQSHQIETNQNNENHIKQKKVLKIFIFDWDDTLFFSTHIRGLKYPVMKFEVIQQTLRQKIDQNVLNILKFCVEKGQVHIVTNSKEGWVKYSSEKFLPKTSEIIFKNSQIKVVSTRPTQQEIFLCNARSKWKYTAFKNILDEIAPKPKQANHSMQEDLHIICIGDSQEQIDATNQIYNQYHDKYQNLYTKTIKLEDFPNAEDLAEQQQLLYSKLQMISNVKKKLIIKLKRPKRLNSKKEI